MPDFDTWKPLLNYRPSAAIQQAILDRGAAWQVHRIDEAASYLNLDYYSVLITKRPFNADQSRRLTANEVFTAYKKHLLNPKRGSAGLVSFSFYPNGGSDIDAVGTLLLLKIKPHPISPYTALGYCQDIVWFKDQPYKAKLQVWADRAMELLLSDQACIVVDVSSPQTLRVSTVRGPVLDVWSVYAFGVTDPANIPIPREHPVAGNREFGYTLPVGKPEEMIVYTIGADRLNGIASLTDDTLATWGYCSAEIFWRQLMNEFATWVTANGGAVQKREPDRKKPSWDEITTQGIYDKNLADTIRWLDHQP